MEFRRYDHVERLGHDEVAGIELGEVYVFPKLDGANASVWADADRVLRAGSRNREVTPGEDNHGFAAWAYAHPQLGEMLRDHPQLIIYGEWLVPHTIKFYRDEAWRRFWIFDVWDRLTEQYLPFEAYRSLARECYGLDVIDPLWRATNPSENQLRKATEGNTFLVCDGAGLGEGVVIKRYDWRNKYGRQPWAKVVRNEFKEENRKAFGVAERGGEYQAELDLAHRAVTPALVVKERAKIEAALRHPGGLLQEAPSDHRRALIPRLLGTVYHAVVTEELWDFVKRTKPAPTIDFGKLQRAVVAETKRCAPDLF